MWNKNTGSAPSRAPGRSPVTAALDLIENAIQGRDEVFPRFEVDAAPRMKVLDTTGEGAPTVCRRMPELHDERLPGREPHDGIRSNSPRRLQSVSATRWLGCHAGDSSQRQPNSQRTNLESLSKVF
jgi:hypothetical protein